MIRSITIAANECTCNKCHHKWVSIGKTPPQNCQNKKCRSRAWNGKKQPSHVDEIKLPRPRKGGRPRIITLIGDDL
jgi:hypothetical protein